MYTTVSLQCCYIGARIITIIVRRPLCTYHRGNAQGREITTADFELLLTLDVSPTPPLHEHLLRALPPCDGPEIGANDTRLLPAPPHALQSQPVQPMLVPPWHPQRLPPALAMTPERVDLSSPALASWEVAPDGGVSVGEHGGRGPSDISLAIAGLRTLPAGGMESVTALSSVPSPAFGASTVTASAASPAGRLWYHW